MISTLLIIVAASWLVLSIVAYFFAKKTFKKYRNYPRMEVASNMGPALRADFGKWDEAAIIKGCFIRFPLHFFMMVSFLGTYGILGTLQKFLKYPDYVIDFFRSRYGRLNTSICLNLVEEFDPKVPVSTPIIIANHVSWIDFIYMGTCLSRSSFVAKIEVKKVPVFGDIANYLKALYVDRSSP
jgi:small basic protein